MSFVCLICNLKWKTGQKSIQCTACLEWVHHDNRNNCSGLTNTEFDTHCNDSSKFWECDKCISQSICVLPFAGTDDNNWLMFTEVKKSNVNVLSDDINVLNSSQIKDFISQCDVVDKLIH